jgi:hypothetical protein
MFLECYLLCGNACVVKYWGIIKGRSDCNPDTAWKLFSTGTAQEKITATNINHLMDAGAGT